MTYKLPHKEHSSFPLRKHEPAEPRAFYALFQYDKFERVWFRVSERAYYSERLAWHMFKDAIIPDPLNHQIRPVKLELDKVQGRRPEHTKLAKFNGTFKACKHPVAHFNPAKEMLAKDDPRQRFAPATRNL